MATFDQLPAEQRAIIELVNQRRPSNDDLAGMLRGLQGPKCELARREPSARVGPEADRP